LELGIKVGGIGVGVEEVMGMEDEWGWGELEGQQVYRFIIHVGITKYEPSNTGYNS
jgi:hypothetical protein